MKIAIRELTNTRHEIFIKGFYKNPITDIDKYGNRYLVQTGYKYRLANLTDGVLGENKQDLYNGFKELRYYISTKDNKMIVTEYNLMSDKIILTFNNDNICIAIEVVYEK